MKQFQLLSVLLAAYLPGACGSMDLSSTGLEDQSDILFEDTMAGNWQQKWFLDGQEATVEHGDGGLYFSGGTVTKKDDPVEYNAHHAVLWTRQEFEGDLRVSFETKRVDDSDYGNVLIYIQAQGVDTPPYEKDISKWSELREVPAMSKYYTYMNLLSVSLRKELRLKRYPLRGPDGTTRLSPIIEPMEDWHGMIKDRWFHFVIEKRKKSLTFRSYDAETGELLKEYTWDTSTQTEDRDPPFVEKGRIGLRHMSTKQSIYKNFKVERL